MSDCATECLTDLENVKGGDHQANFSATLLLQLHFTSFIDEVTPDRRQCSLLHAAEHDFISVTPSHKIRSLQISLQFWSTYIRIEQVQNCHCLVELLLTDCAEALVCHYSKLDVDVLVKLCDARRIIKTTEEKYRDPDTQEKLIHFPKCHSVAKEDRIQRLYAVELWSSILRQQRDICNPIYKVTASQILQYAN